MLEIKVEPLSRENFAPFGDVIELAGASHYPINNGTTERYHDLARIHAEGTDARVLLNIFVGEPRPQPLEICMLERHPYGSQAFYPLQNQPWLIVVAEKPEAQALRAFMASGEQGVNYAANVWHHPLLVFQPNSRFLVVDRHGVEKNLEEVFFDAVRLQGL